MMASELVSYKDVVAAVTAHGRDDHHVASCRSHQKIAPTLQRYVVADIDAHGWCCAAVAEQQP